MCDADTEANVMSEPAPFARQGSDGFTRLQRHQHGLECRVLDRNRIVEDDHHAVTGVTFERATVLDDLLANGRVVLAEQFHYVFRIGALSEAGEAAQVTEERGNLWRFYVVARTSTSLMEEDGCSILETPRGTPTGRVK